MAALCTNFYDPLVFSFSEKASDPKALQAAVDDILERMHSAVKPVLIAGMTRVAVSIVVFMLKHSHTANVM